MKNILLFFSKNLRTLKREFLKGGETMAKKTAKRHGKKISHLHFIIVTLSIFVIIFGYLWMREQSNATDLKLQWQKQVSKKQCDTTGSPVIDVNQKIVNDVDSGEAGNYWAFDTFNRHMQVWQQTDNSFCALVKYDGKFDAQAGQRSPGNTGVLTGSEDGNFDGGYRATITGTLKANPDLSTHGSIGTTDYQCDIAGNCPGYFDWTSKYFNTASTGFASTLTWWGWTYHAKGNHIWINSIDGNSGDVL